MNNGKFIGKSLGYGGEIELEVTILNDVITDISILNHSETKVISDPAFEQILPKIIKDNTVCVPNVSGCSITSMALKNAVANALQKAQANSDKLATDILESQTLEKLANARKINIKANYDVIVVGSGGAGLASAISAVQNGASVLVIEKRNTLGGNTLVSMGGVNIPCNDAQIDTNVEDSNELYYNDILVGGDNESIESQVKTLVDNAHSTYKWLQNDIGVNFKDKTLIHFGGHSVARATVFEGKYAIELITKLRKKAEELGVTIASGVSVNDLLVQNGRVCGVKTQNQTISANFGVILATGGFSGNVEMRKKYDPDLDERYKTTNVSGIDGDGHIMCEKIGAKFVNMDYIQTFPIANPKTGELSHVGGSRFDGAVLVNLEGERFVEELERRDVVSNGILAQTGSVAYLVWSKEVEDINNGVTKNASEITRLENDNFFYEDASIAEIANKIGVNSEVLEKTIDKYNGFVENKNDLDFKRRGELISIKKSPFYIQAVAPAVHHTMGGVCINEKCQVISTENTVIKGLYASGEIVGGTHGTNRLGGNAITEILVFGKIAGKSIVSDK